MKEVKRRAVEQGKTLTRFIEEALRRTLVQDGRRKTGRRFRWVTFRGRLLPGVDLSDRDSLYEKMEGRR